MAIRTVIACFVAVGFLGACERGNEVQEARKDLQETQQEAAKDVSSAQTEAVKDVNEQKKESAEDIQESRKDLAEAQRDAAKDAADEDRSTIGTTSGATTAGGSNKPHVTAEQCAQLAKEKSAKPENKALYDACQDLEKSKKK